MDTITYYSINIRIPGGAPLKLNYQQDKNDLYLSANGALCGLNKLASLDSPELAARFMEAYMPRLQKRYGSDVEVGIGKWTSHGNFKRTLARIKKDSDRARLRLETGILASNAKL